MFTAAENLACRRLVELALEEDLGSRGDVTSQAFIPATALGRAVLVARAPGVIAGLPAAIMVLSAVSPQNQVDAKLQDGSAVKPGDRIALIAGPTRAILAAERVALNFLQHLSGVATMARAFVQAIAGLPVQILDTRKTLPGWRLLEKYAVRQGGAHNHRIGLYDGILVKDNHLAALSPGSGLESPHFQATIRSSGLPVEIETENLTQVDLALNCRPDVVLLDNMSLDLLREAVQRRNSKAPGVLLEASGGIALSNVRAIAETGIDRISIGAITHSAPALDLALDYTT
jgi:nicotinate-nucleotide pyrophosphorylase (carboxylating)